MPLEITPAPAEEVRAALVQALERELADAGPPASAWWSAGVRESVGADDPD